MQHFTVNPRDGGMTGSACDTCCCQPMTVRPGEINLIAINYAPWSVPLGGRGLSTITDFNIENIRNCPVSSSGNLAPVASNLYSFTPFNTALVGVLSSVVVDAEGNPLTFKHLSVYGPRNGTVVLNANGNFTYTPLVGFSGLDRFFYSVEDAFGKGPVVAEVVISVYPQLPNLPPVVIPTLANATPPIRIVSSRVKTNTRMHTIEFPIESSPALCSGDIFRLTIRKESLDCDLNTFVHISCYDIHVTAC